MVGFAPPEVPENDEGWGPHTVPEHLEGVPYAPFGKGDKLGKASDWVVTGYNKYGGGRFGSQGGAVNTVFNFFHNEEEEGAFHVVDNRPVQKPRYGARRFQQNRFPRRDRDGPNRESGSGADRERQRRERQQQAKRGNWAGNFWNRDQQKVVYSSSVDIRPEWSVLEQVQLATYTKMNYKMTGEPVDLATCGQIKPFDKSYDLVTPKSERAVKKFKKTQFFNVTTSEDPVMRKLADQGKGTVFATEGILSTLMCASRSNYSWDVVVTRQGDKLFFDRRDNAPDMVTVNETAQDPVTDEKENMNGVPQLSQEATMINQNFSQQVLVADAKPHRFAEPSPFADEDEGPVAQVAYRYRQWTLGDQKLVVRTELDGVTQQKGADAYMKVKALNEFDSKVTGVDWRQKIENQRGAVLATELKNNSNKLAKWTAQALLSGAHLLKIGYVSRAHPRANNEHVILGTQTTKPRDFAMQMNLNMDNCWGILKSMVDMCMKLGDGKYLFVKDPNKPLLRLYEVPENAFDNDYSEDPLDAEETTQLTGATRHRGKDDDDL